MLTGDCLYRLLRKGAPADFETSFLRSQGSRFDGDTVAVSTVPATFDTPGGIVVGMTTSTLASRLRARFGRRRDDRTLGSSVSAARAVELVRDGAALIDVRESQEWKSGHAPQAIHVPLGKIDTAPRRLSASTPVLVVCASGMRSRTGAKKLRDAGFEAASVSGGMSAWEQAGGAVRR